MSRKVKLQMERDNAEKLLDRLYAERYNDHEMTTVAFQVPVGTAIGELEASFPRLAKEFDNND